MLHAPVLPYPLIMWFQWYLFGNKITKLLIMQLYLLSGHFLSLRPNTPHSTLFQNTLFVINLTVALLRRFGLASIPGQCMWRLWWKKWHCDKFLSQCPSSKPIHSPTTHAIKCFSLSTSVFPCQYHSTNAPYLFIHLPLTLYNVSLQVLLFSPVRTIPPMLHTHSFTYHPHDIMFVSQHFRFPLSVPLHQRSIPIYSPTTHAI